MNLYQEALGIKDEIVENRKQSRPFGVVAVTESLVAYQNQAVGNHCNHKTVLA